MNSDRRRFFRASSAAVAAGLVPGACRGSGSTRAATGPADLIITGARLLTMDPAIPSAPALAVRGRHILAVGSDGDIENLAGPDTERVDARGLTVTPGFVDAHSHPLSAGEAIAANVNLRRISEVRPPWRRRPPRRHRDTGFGARCTTTPSSRTGAR